MLSGLKILLWLQLFEAFEWMFYSCENKRWLLAFVVSKITSFDLWPLHFNNHEKAANMREQNKNKDRIKNDKKNE